MATGTLTGTNYAIANAPTPSTLLESSKWGGKVRCIEDIITAAAAYDAASIVKIGALPKGAIPIMTVIKYSGSATMTLAVGSTADTDLLGVFTALGTTPTQMALPSIPNTPLTADTVMEMLVAATGIASGDIFHVKMLYAVE
jgi:hypothetical protein